MPAGNKIFNRCDFSLGKRCIASGEVWVYVNINQTSKGIPPSIGQKKSRHGQAIIAGWLNAYVLESTNNIQPHIEISNGKSSKTESKPFATSNQHTFRSIIVIQITGVNSFASTKSRWIKSSRTNRGYKNKTRTLELLFIRIQYVKKVVKTPIEINRD